MATAASTLPDFTGCIIDEHFELVKMLGSGTYGVVYKAVDMRVPASSPSRFRAIKIICKTGRSRTEIATIRREIALHTAVSHHSSVVGIHDAFEDDVYCYIILDFCRGGDLFGQICEKKVYENNDELLRGAFVSLVDAVMACHEAKIAHRDLKPENVLSSEDGSRVYLADFGLATNKLVVDEYWIGTTIYMSPECGGEIFGHRSYYAHPCDIWALGVILINMISGGNPWSAPTLKDSSFVRFIMDPNFLRSFPVSDGAFAILSSMLEMNPYKRISLHELRKAILSLDTFFSPEHKHQHARKHEHEHEHPHHRADAKPVFDSLEEVALCTLTAPPGLSSVAAEIDIRVRLPKPAVRERAYCSAGSASDIPTTTTTTTTPTTSSSSCSSSRASSGDSDLDLESIITPAEAIWEEIRMAAYRKVAGELEWQKGLMVQLLPMDHRLNHTIN